MEEDSDNDRLELMDYINKSIRYDQIYERLRALKRGYSRQRSSFPGVYSVTSQSQLRRGTIPVPDRNTSNSSGKYRKGTKEWDT